jgi:hypothetical protein
MERLQVSQILVKNATLKAIQLTEAGTKKFIDETRQKQAKVRKLKEVDQDMLKMVVQL